MDQEALYCPHVRTSQDCRFVFKLFPLPSIRMPRILFWSYGHNLAWQIDIRICTRYWAINSNYLPVVSIQPPPVQNGVSAGIGPL
jgi:hypothetical protein